MRNGKINWNISPEDFTLGKRIGTGHFGEVYEGHLQSLVEQSSSFQVS